MTKLLTESGFKNLLFRGDAWTPYMYINDLGLCSAGALPPAAGPTDLL